MRGVCEVRIAFVAKAGAGKTTLAMLLVKHHGFTKLSFANVLKEFATNVLSRPLDKKRDRQFLQMMGEGARQSDVDVWIRWLHIQLQAYERASVTDFVVDDVRYVNEAEWLRKQGFIIVRLVGRSYKMKAELAEHPSETKMAEIEADFEVDASGTVEEMWKNFVKKCFKHSSAGRNLAEGLHYATLKDCGQS